MDHRKGKIIGFGGVAVTFALLLIAVFVELVIQDFLFLRVFFWITSPIVLMFGSYGIWHLSIELDEEFYEHFYGENKD